MLDRMINLTQDYFYEIAVGVVILLAGFVFGLLAKKISYRVFQAAQLNKAGSRAGIVINLEVMLSSLLSWLIYFSSIVLFLNRLEITSIVLYLIAGAILLLVALTVLVGLKDIIPNFAAWVRLRKRNSFVVGRDVNINGIVGTVEKIGHLKTIIRTKNQDSLHAPNTLFLKHNL